MGHLIELNPQITTFEARGHSSLMIMTTFHIPPSAGGLAPGQKGGPLGLKWQFFELFDVYGQQTGC